MRVTCAPVQSADEKCVFVSFSLLLRILIENSVHWSIVIFLVFTMITNAIQMFSMFSRFGLCVCVCVCVHVINLANKYNSNYPSHKHMLFIMSSIFNLVCSIQIGICFRDNYWIKQNKTYVFSLELNGLISFRRNDE